MQLLGNIDFLSFIKSNNKELATKQKTRRPEWNFGIPALPPAGGKPVPVVKITFQNNNNPQHLHTPVDNTEIHPHAPIEVDNNSIDIVPVNSNPSFFTAFPAIPGDHQESSGSSSDNSTISSSSTTNTNIDDSSSFNLAFPVIPSDQEEFRGQADDSSNPNSISTHDFSFLSSFPTIPVSHSSVFPFISLKPESSSNVFPDFKENLNFLFGRPAASPAPAENNLIFGRPEKQILTNVAAQANLREAPKFFFGPTKSEEEDSDETAEITEQETRSEGQSNFSQVNISQLSDPLQQEKRENKTHLKSTTEEEEEEEKISEELDIASLFADYNSSIPDSHYDYDLSSLFDDYLLDYE